MVRYVNVSGAAVAEIVTGDGPMMPLDSLVAVKAPRSLARSMKRVSPSATATSSIACRRIVAAS